MAYPAPCGGLGEMVASGHTVCHYAMDRLCHAASAPEVDMLNLSSGTWEPHKNVEAEDVGRL